MDAEPRRLPTIIDADGALPGAANALPDAPPLDYLVMLWLADQRSPRTQREYQTTLADYRAMLASVHLDLDCGDHHKLAQVAQQWSRRASRQRARMGQEPSSATIARRLAIVSSFYTFGLRNGLHEWRRDRRSGEVSLDEATVNPLRLLKRPPVQRYAEAQPIPARDLEARLRAIDRATLEGKRDYALVMVAVMTGRRVAELAGMRWRSVSVGRDRIVTLRFDTKGRKVMRDKLPRMTSEALLDYLRALYATEEPHTLAPDAPIWRPLSRATPAREAHERAGVAQGMTTSGIRRVFGRRLALTKVHASRHTFASLMEQAGASLSDIQARLGHSNAATTAQYLNALKSADNPYGERIAALLGLE